MRERRITQREKKSLDGRVDFELITTEAGQILTLRVCDPDYRSMSSRLPVWEFYLEQTTAQDLVDLAGMLLDLAEGGQIQMTAPEPPRQKFISLQEWLKKKREVEG